MENKKSYIEFLEDARNLPQDSSTPIYQLFDGFEGTIYFTMTKDNPTPVDFFNSNYKGVGKFGKSYKERSEGWYYVKHSKVGDDGKILPKGVWNEKLFWHKKWGRHDTEITKVEFDIVGLKRRSAKLEAGVLVSNIRFS